ncbi:MAG: PilN domain-containing protein [Desulfuromonadaceae bacterium]|nr:PilN domain-containing protein [Desulfuromonadaceae bacterium]
MRFTINLATRTYLDHRLLNRLAACIICVLVIITGWNVIRFTTHLGEQSRLDLEITTLQNKLGAKPSGISDTEYNRQKARIRFYNGIIERKSTNWFSVLDALENVTPVGISLSSLSPDKKQEEWKLEGRAKSFKLVQLYVEKLEASKNFSNTLLISHQNLTANEYGSGVQFVITCKVVN